MAGKVTCLRASLEPFFVVLGDESGDVHVLGKWSTIKPNLQAPKYFKVNCYKIMTER